MISRIKESFCGFCGVLGALITFKKGVGVNGVIGGCTSPRIGVLGLVVVVRRSGDSGGSDFDLFFFIVKDQGCFGVNRDFRTKVSPDARGKFFAGSSLLGLPFRRLHRNAQSVRRLREL